MSKTKSEVIDNQNEQQEANPLLAILQADETIAATVGEAYFWKRQLPLPAVYVQGTERVITATAKAGDISGLTSAVAAALTKNGRTAYTSPIYGDEYVTGGVWQVIDTQLKP